MVIVDKVGQKIEVGSLVVYGHALGRCAGLRIGKVLRIEEAKKGYSSWDGDTPEGVKITVWGIDDDWDHKEIKLCSTRGTLFFPNRILVLDESAVRQDFRDLLAPVTIESTAKSLGIKKG